MALFVSLSAQCCAFESALFCAHHKHPTPIKPITKSQRKPKV
jgi:hypothetical protein